MRVAVAFGVLATLALAYGAPHGIFPHTVEFVDQKLITEHVKPVYGYRVRTSTAREHPFAFGYKIKSAAPVVVHSEESADAEGHGTGGFNYAFKTVAPVATPVAVGGVIATPVTFSSRKITEKILGQESVEGGSSAADTVKVDAEQYLVSGPVSSEKSGSFAYSLTADAPVVAPATIVAAAPVGVAVEHRLAGFGEKISHEQIPGSFSYSYNAEAPVVAAPVVHHSVVGAHVPVTSFVKTVDRVEDKGSQGSFSYSITADAPLVGHTAAVLEAAQAVEAKSVDTQVDDKSSGSFSYSFNAEAPVAGAVIAPVVAAPVHTAYTTSVVKDEANIANRGSFSYSVSADAPIVAAPVHTAYTTSRVKDEANIANRGSFSYSVTADAPVVAPVSYVASAPVGVSYEHTVVESGDKISDEKGSGAFAYSYSVDEPAVVAPVVHHSVVAAPAYTGAFVKTVDHVEDAGSRGAFSYSVTADAPLVGHSAAVVGAAQAVDTKSIDVQAEDKSSGSFSYSFSAEAPIRSAVVAPVVAAPVHTAYTTSVVSDEAAAIGNRGSFSYSVSADAPVVAPVSYVAAAPVGVEYGQTVVQYGDKIADEKSSGAFGYSYHVDAPAVVGPVVHHSVIAQPVQTESLVKTVEYSQDISSHDDGSSVDVSQDMSSGSAVDSHVEVKTVGVDSVEKPSGAFSYSFTADAPVRAAVVAPVVAAPVHTAYTTSVVQDEANIANRGSFSYSVTADAPVVAPVSYVASAPVGVSYEHTVVESGDKISDEKGSGAFAYSYSVDEPAVVAPVVHHSVVAAPAYTGAFVKTVDHVEDAGSRGAFSYSVTADAPLVGHSAAVVGAAQVVDTKSIDAQTEDKSSGSFSYSFSAEAPIRSAVVAPVVAAPVHTAYTTSVVSDEAAAIGNRGSFSYSVSADAPVVAPVSYVAAAPVGVEYGQTVVQYGDKIADEKSSGAFGYSYQVDAPAVVAPVVHQSVIAQPAQIIDTKSVDTQAEDKISSSFSYSFSAEAPVAAAVVPAPVHTAYTTSAVKDEAAIGNRGSFSYSVSADAPVVAPVSYVAAAPVGVEYEQTLVQYGDKISDDKGSEAFGYSYHVDAPAVVAPVAHHAVVTQPIHTGSIFRTVEFSDAAAHGDAKVETKTVDASSEDKSSGSFSYSISAEAPVAHVGGPVFHSSSVVGGVPVAVRGSVLKTDYVNPISAVSLGVTTDDLKLHSIGSFEGVYGVRTAPVNTLVTGVQHAPIGYGVPITIKCD